VVRVQDVAAALPFGATVSDVITQPGHAFLYSFTLEQPRQLFLDTFINDSEARWQLTGPFGTVVDTRGFNLGGRELILGAGTYTLRVDRSADSTGAFAFRVTDMASGAAILPGQQVGVTNTPAGGRQLLPLRGRGRRAHLPRRAPAARRAARTGASTTRPGSSW
jgi:hypothetical protein